MYLCSSGRGDIAGQIHFDTNRIDFLIGIISLETISTCKKTLCQNDIVPGWLLSIFYDRVISHGHLPDYFMKTSIIPLVKCGDTSNVNYYRPISLVTVASKIFEIILLERLTPYLDTTDNQFGFKKGHSTDYCIFAFKMLFSTIEVTIAQCIPALLTLQNRLTESVT